jgi:PPM family protein phosphatase
MATPFTDVPATGGHVDTETRGALCAAASRTCKRINQDAARRFANPALDLYGMAIADGLGSHFGAEEGSALVVAEISRAIEGAASFVAADLPILFDDVNQILTATVLGKADLPPDLDIGAAFGTTAICAVDSRDAWTIGYVGNGAVLHVRGDFNAAPAAQLLPWSAVNLLNPHAVSERGRSALYKFFAPCAPAAQVTPTVLTVSKDDSVFGDMVVLCTDGIASLDQTTVGTDDDGQIWIKGDTSIALLYQHLSAFFAASVLTNAALEATLAGYLEALESRGLVSDDCTLGVLISPTAIRYQQRRSQPAPATA